LPEGKSGLTVVVDDSCGHAYTYDLQGPQGHLIGQGDLHDTKYGNVEFQASFASGIGSVKTGHCYYAMDMYASDEFSSSYGE
jgi:hypothetical protein